VLNDRHQEDKSAERLVPILEGVDGKESYDKREEGKSNHKLKNTEDRIKNIEKANLNWKNGIME